MPTPPSVGESMADAEVAIVVPAVDADKAEKSVISTPAATEPLERLDPPKAVAPVLAKGTGAVCAATLYRTDNTSWP